MSALLCGIDFGTSNSSVAVSSETLPPRLIKVEKNKTTIPSTIFYETGKIQPIFGQQAVDAYISGQEGRFMRSLKRVLGTDLMTVGTQINGKPVKFENILSQFIKYLKNKIEEELQLEAESVVMGRPVHFRDNDIKGDIAAEKELAQIAHMVGFKNVVFQYEPNGAKLTLFIHIKISVLSMKYMLMLTISLNMAGWSN